MHKGHSHHKKMAEHKHKHGLKLIKEAHGHMKKHHAAKHAAKKHHAKKK